jgi:hypothetical protein
MSDIKYCGQRDCSGHGTSDTCGKEVWGEGSPIYQCVRCSRKQIESQQQEIAELKAMVNEFIEEFSCFVAQHECNCGHPSCRTCKECKDAFKLLDKTPKQCLASVKADAIDEAVKSCSPGSGFPPDDPPQGLQEYCEALYSVSQYAQQLREQK